MKKVLLVFLPLLLPSILAAQGTIKVASVYGSVEWKALSTAAFVSLSPSNLRINPGDEVRTGPGGKLTLELLDGSYLVISENSMFTIQDLGRFNVRHVVNAVMRKVRFYIQGFGGRSNPHRIGAATALIAVRG